ncbi:MAG: hypothetical protein NTU48_01530 [Legionellales bacterium]|nr:hypothetical protein [Legionellales bacterium]
MTKMTFFETIKADAITGAEYGCLAAASLVGISASSTLYILNYSDDQVYQYIYVASMFEAYQLAVTLPGAGMAFGASAAAIKYYIQSPDEEENENEEDVNAIHSIR